MRWEAVNGRKKWSGSLPYPVKDCRKTEERNSDLGKSKTVWKHSLQSLSTNMARVVVLQKQGHPSFSILSFSVSDFDGARLHNHISWVRTPLPKAALQVTASRFPVKDSRQVLTTSFISVYCFCSFFFFHIVEDIEINCLRTLIICILLWFLDDDFV